MSQPYRNPQARAKNALLGLALGDALSWPAMFHRSLSYPHWTRRLRREMDVMAEATKVLRPQMPFSLNQPAAGFAPGPTDDTEWAAFVMETWLRAEDSSFADATYQAWTGLAHSDADIWGSVSTQAALDNLRKGKVPPLTGHDNPHYFDDGACARAVPIGVLCAGQPSRAVELAAIDASITNSEDGLWAAQAVAAAISVACAGGNVSELIDAARATLPKESWIARIVSDVLDSTVVPDSLLELTYQLAGEVVNREYNYGTAAPETLAVALALTRYTSGDIEQGILGATAIAKVSDTGAALTGAFCGALTDEFSLSPQLAAQMQTLSGLCIPSLRGVDYLNLIDEWADHTSQNNSRL